MRANKIIDYGALIERATAGFVGRAWVRKTIDEFLGATGPRVLLLLGEPGCGKTAFLAQLVQERGYPHHFIGKGSLAGLESSADWRNPIRFAESVGYQLLRDYGGWIMDWESWGIKVEQHVKDLEGLLVGAEIGTLTVEPRAANRPMLTVTQEIERFGAAAQVVGVFVDKYVMDAEQVVRQLLTVPLQRIAGRFPDQQIIIVVDGLDEAEGYSNPQATILRLLPGAEAPVTVRLLVSSRPGEHLTHEFMSGCQTLWLSEDRQGLLDEHILSDARQFARRLAKESAVSQALAERTIPVEDFAAQVASASQGNFLYLYYFATGVRGGDLSLLDVAHLPRGLFGIYGDFLGKIKARRDGVSWDDAYKPVLGVLAAARAPFTRAQIVQSTRHAQRRPAGVPAAATATILQEIEPFLDSQGSGKDKRYAMYHVSFGEFLLSDDNEDLIDGGQAHAGIASYCAALCGATWTPCAGPNGSPAIAAAEAGYALRYTPTHLAQAVQHALLPDEHAEWAGRLHALVRDERFRAAKERRIGNPLGILADLRLALEVALADGDPATAWRHMMGYRRVLHEQRAFTNLQADVSNGAFDAALDRTLLYRNLPNSQAMAFLWIAWQAATAKPPQPEIALAAAQRAIKDLPRLANVSPDVESAGVSASDEDGNALREALQRLLVRVALDAAPGGMEDQQEWLYNVTYDQPGEITQLHARLAELYDWWESAGDQSPPAAEHSHPPDRFQPWTTVEDAGALPPSMETLLDELERELAAGGVAANERIFSHRYPRRMAAGLIKSRNETAWPNYVQRAVDLIALDDYPSYREMALAWVAQAVLCKEGAAGSQEDARSALASVLAGAFDVAAPGFWGDSIAATLDGRWRAAGVDLDPAVLLDSLANHHVDPTITLRFDQKEEVRREHGLPVDPWALQMRRKSAVAAALRQRRLLPAAHDLLTDAGDPNNQRYLDSYAGFRALARLSLACRWLEWDEPGEAQEQIRKAKDDASWMLDPVLKQERQLLIGRFERWHAELTDQAVVGAESLTQARSLAGLDLPIYLELLSALRCAVARQSGGAPDLAPLLLLALEDATAADAVFGRWLDVLGDRAGDGQQFVALCQAMEL